MIIATTRNKYLRLPMLPYSLLELYKRNLDDLTSHWLLLLLTLQRAHLFLAFLSHFTFQQTPIPNYSALHYSKIPSNSLYTVLHQLTIDVQHHVKNGSDIWSFIVFPGKFTTNTFISMGKAPLHSSPHLSIGVQCAGAGSDRLHSSQKRMTGQQWWVFNLGPW